MSDFQLPILLGKTAMQLDIDISTMVAFLQKHGINIKNDPHTRLNKESYSLLVKEFQKNITTNSTDQKIGIVKSFNSGQGFGFITCLDNKREYFFHISNVVDHSILPSTYVVFHLALSINKPGTKEAIQINYFKNNTLSKDRLIQLFSLFSIESFRKIIISLLPETEVLNLAAKEISATKSINTEYECSSYLNKCKQIHSLFDKTNLLLEINNYIDIHASRIASPIAKVILWLEGTIKDTPDFEIIFNFFSSNTSYKYRLLILKNLSKEKQKDFFEYLFKNEAPERVFILIEKFLQEINGLDASQENISLFSNNNFWSSKIDYNIYTEAINYYSKSLNKDDLLELKIAGYIPSNPLDLFFENFKELNHHDLKSIIRSKILSESDLVVIFNKLLSETYQHEEEELPYHLSWILDMALELLDESAVEKIKNKITSDSSDETLFDLWRKGYLKIFPAASISYYLSTQENIQVAIDSWISLNLCSEQEIIELLLGNIYNLKKIETNQQFNVFVTHLNALQNLNADTAKLQLSIIKDNFLNLNEYFSKFLLSNITIHEHINSWISKGLISREKLINIIIANINTIGKIKTKQQFYKLIDHLDALLNLKFDNSQLYSKIPADYIWCNKLISWIKGTSEEFNFEHFKTIFIFLSPSHQILFLKKLFWLKHTGVYDFTIDNLKELSRVDYDLLNSNQSFNNDIFIDISVEIVIEALNSFITTGKFLKHNDLINLVFNSYNKNSNEKLEILTLFEPCQGRYLPEFDWKSSGRVTKTASGWEIEFEYNNNLVLAVKSLSGRTYNPQSRKWLVPLSEEPAVIQFAETNRFFIQKNGNNYANNLHFAKWARSNYSNTPFFCEGRLADKLHQIYGISFWWCHNKPCFKNCEADHTDPYYQEYEVYPNNEQVLNRIQQNDHDDLPF